MKPEPLDRGRCETSFHVRRIVHEDDERSWAWVVARLAPLLEAQARYRLQGPLARIWEPADVVDEVWSRAMDRLASLEAREGRLTPVLIRFLSSVLLNRVNELLREHARHGAAWTITPGSSLGSWHPAASEAFAAARGALRSEVAEQLRSAMAKLSEPEREVIVLRGIEQLPNALAAERVGVEPGTLATRYHRALRRLRERLPPALMEDLFDSDETP